MAVQWELLKKLMDESPELREKVGSGKVIPLPPKPAVRPEEGMSFDDIINLSAKTAGAPKSKKRKK